MLIESLPHPTEKERVLLENPFILAKAINSWTGR